MVYQEIPVKLPDGLSEDQVLGFKPFTVRALICFRGPR
jgi:hypothetical protein